MHGAGLIEAAPPAENQITYFRLRAAHTPANPTNTSEAEEGSGTISKEVVMA